MLLSLRAYVEELVEKWSACAVSQSAKDLLARAKQLHADQVEFSKGSLSPDRVTFESANIADITSRRMALIGWIALNGEPCILCTCLVKCVLRYRRNLTAYALVLSSVDFVKRFARKALGSSNCGLEIILAVGCTVNIHAK